MPCKAFGDGVFPKETPSKRRKPRLFLGLWFYPSLETSPWNSSNICRGDAGYPGQAYEKPTRNSREDMLCAVEKVWPHRGGYQVTPITPDEPDVLDVGDVVEGVWGGYLRLRERVPQTCRCEMA